MISRYLEYTPEIHEKAFIAPGSNVIGKVRIGKNSSVWHNVVIRGDIDFIYIGDNSNIQECSSLHCSTNLKLIIGNDVTIGHGAILHSCEIGDGSLIGMGSTVLDGAIIGKNCLVGAGALITPGTVIPDGSMVIGSPGKVKRQLSEAEKESISENARVYCQLAENYRKQ